MCVKNKGQVYLTSLLTPHVLQYVKQRKEKVTQPLASLPERYIGLQEVINKQVEVPQLF